MTPGTAPETCRRTDPATGVIAEVGTDGVPVGLALPDRLLDRAPTEVARAVLRTLTAAAGEARDLLERLADEDWDGSDPYADLWDDPAQQQGEAHPADRERDGAR